MIDLKTYALGLLAALVIGFGGGYYTHAKFSAAKQVVTLKKDIKDSAKGIEQATVKSQAVEAKVQQSNKTADAERDAALNRVTKQLERTHDLLQTQIAPQLDAASKAVLASACDNPHLDVGTVRLLNAARQDASLVPARRGDAAGATAADSGG